MNRILVTLAAACAFSSMAKAADVSPVVTPAADWFVKIGGTYVVPNSASSGLGANNITAGNAVTASIEAGRFLTDRFSISLTGGIPPTHEIFLNGGDTGGHVTLGAFAVDGQFHLVNNDRFDAYVGGGLAYNIYFSNTVTVPAPINSIDDGFAPVLQAGVEFKASQHLGVFVDAKKEFYSTTVHTTGPTFTERLDPLVVTAGVAFHF